MAAFVQSPFVKLRTGIVEGQDSARLPDSPDSEIVTLLRAIRSGTRLC